MLSTFRAIWLIFTIPTTTQTTHIMNIYLRYNIDKMGRVILREQLDKFNFKYTITDSCCVYFHEDVPETEYFKLYRTLDRYGIEIIDNKKAILVQKVKAIITNMLDNSNIPLMKISSYLADEMGENYRTLAQIFTEVCHINIESFIIIHKIERVKQMLLGEHLSLTEISYKLNYSSVAHLSNQFKKFTGLTPSTFQRLAHGRRNFKAEMIN